MRGRMLCIVNFIQTTFLPFQSIRHSELELFCFCCSHRLECAIDWNVLIEDLKSGKSSPLGVLGHASMI